MSNRERWIVYPLLFLALLLGWKGILPPPRDLDCRSIQCSQIVVSAVNGTTRVRIGTSPSQSGEVRLYGANGQATVALGTDRTGTNGVVETLDEQRNLRSVTGGDSAGGFVRLYGGPDELSLFLGYDGSHDLMGLVAQNEQGKPLVLSANDRSALWGMWLPGNLGRATQAPSSGPAETNDTNPPPSDESARDASGKQPDQGSVPVPPDSAPGHADSGPPVTPEPPEQPHGPLNHQEQTNGGGEQPGSSPTPQGAKGVNQPAETPEPSPHGD